MLLKGWTGHGSVDMHYHLLGQRNQFKIAFYFLSQNSEDLNPWHKNLNWKGKFCQVYITYLLAMDFGRLP